MAAGFCPGGMILLAVPAAAQGRRGDYGAADPDIAACARRVDSDA